MRELMGNPSSWGSAGVQPGLQPRAMIRGGLSDMRSLQLISTGNFQTLPPTNTSDNDDWSPTPAPILGFVETQPPSREPPVAAAAEQGDHDISNSSTNNMSTLAIALVVVAAVVLTVGLGTGFLLWGKKRKPNHRLASADIASDLEEPADVLSPSRRRMDQLGAFPTPSPPRPAKRRNTLQTHDDSSSSHNSPQSAQEVARSRIDAVLQELKEKQQAEQRQAEHQEMQDYMASLESASEALRAPAPPSPPKVPSKNVDSDDDEKLDFTQHHQLVAQHEQEERRLSKQHKKRPTLMEYLQPNAEPNTDNKKQPTSFDEYGNPQDYEGSNTSFDDLPRLHNNYHESSGTTTGLSVASESVYTNAI